MAGIKSSSRLALSVGIVGATMLWLASDIGIIPSPVQSVLDSRVSLAKVVAVDASNAVEKSRIRDFRNLIETLVVSDDDLHSVALIRRDNSTAVATKNHQVLWQKEEQYPPSCRVSAEVFQNSRKWGKLQILFNPNNEYIASSWKYPLTPVMFLFASLTIATWMMLGQTFRYLNPSKVVPNRVRSALDTLTEGLVLIDPNSEIVHSNKAFGEMIDADPDKLVGTALSEIDWKHVEESDVGEAPWESCLLAKESIRGRIVELRSDNQSKKYIVNSSPVYGGGDKVKGALISFDDVTDLERKKSELADIILTLRKSRDEVARQNEELYFLANCDPLTKCYNRRSFWNQYNEMWNECETGRLNLIMVDIDHFKSINDNYGHSTGDEVLKENGELLRRMVDSRGSVCRYGGEEFVILLPNMSLDDATGVAHEIHREYQKVQLGGISVTASLGVSNTALGVMDMQHLLDQADQCLYAAKRNGRNQVVRYDQCDHEMSDTSDEASFENPSLNINYSTVTGLLSALAFKCPRTAEHSMRVADLCVAIGQKLVNKRKLYRLEICGLLHDIGKIGVPDNILNKPGPLTDTEWETMKKHDEYGVSIIKSAFESEEIANIIKFHKESFAAQSLMATSLLRANEVPVESRIITVCDAFDSMIGDRIYRPAQSLESAFAELRRCSPDQFDPVVVEHLIQYASQPAFLESRNVVVRTTQQSAVAIAKHLEELHSAVANENLRELKEVVDNLKNDGECNGVRMISEATDRLEEVMSTDDSKLSQVMEIAEEVMQLCRSTRSSFVNSGEP